MHAAISRGWKNGQSPYIVTHLYLCTFLFTLLCLFCSVSRIPYRATPILQGRNTIRYLDGKKPHEIAGRGLHWSQCIANPKITWDKRVKSQIPIFWAEEGFCIFDPVSKAPNPKVPYFFRVGWGLCVDLISNFYAIQSCLTATRIIIT